MPGPPVDAGRAADRMLARQLLPTGGVRASAVVHTHPRDHKGPELKLVQIERPYARLKRRQRGGCALEARFVEHDAEGPRTRMIDVHWLRSGSHVGEPR